MSTMESSNKTSAWVSIAIGSLTVLSAVLGANVAGLRWLLYLCGTTLSISCTFLVWDRFFSQKYQYWTLERNRRKALKKYLNEYLKHISRLKVLEDLDRALGSDRIEWRKARPYFFGGTTNTLSIIELCLKDLPQEYRLKTTNIMLAVLVRAFDAWLQTCDGMLQNGDAKYLTERNKNDVVNLLRDFQNATSSHDLLCEKINDDAGEKKLVVSFYCQKHSFDWLNALPQVPASPNNQL